MDPKIYQFSHIPFPKLDGFENPYQKINGFGRTHQTHADGATDKSGIILILHVAFLLISAKLDQNFLFLH